MLITGKERRTIVTKATEIHHYNNYNDADVFVIIRAELL